MVQSSHEVNPMKKKYTLVGYEKDSDVYETISHSDSIEDLRQKARTLIEKETRCKSTKEPVDWFEILNTGDETRIEVIA